MKILLAEDEWQMSNVLTTAMTHQGYDVDVVFNGQEAIDKAKDNAYDIMILDIMMPIKSGIEAFKGDSRFRKLLTYYYADGYGRN